MIDFDKVNEYRENNRLEVKRAQGGLPNSIWETYSAFANTNGGVILLGVEESTDKSLNVIGLANPEKLIADFWNTINNTQKVSINILKDKNVKIIPCDDKQLISIEIPRAERMDKPIYLNNDIWSSYRRNGEGDYRCRKASVRAMLRDNANETQDMLVLEKMPFSVFDYETVKGYRNVMKSTRPNHVWSSLDDDEFLMKLGAISRGDDEKLHPTAAGLLMFGFEYEIVREYPRYFLDYQEHFDAGLRWTDRITSTSGEWSGNLFEFYYKAYNKIIQNPSIKIPFKIENGHRVDDTPVHKALREALANCLINADFYGEGGVVIRNYTDNITIENPGTLRIKIEEAISGGFSNPRNSALMKMFNLLDIGERAGSGIPNIYSVWETQGWGNPQIIERFESFERVKLLLPLTKVAIKNSCKPGSSDISSDKMSDKPGSSDISSDIMSDKPGSSDKKKLILELAKKNDAIKIADLASALAVTPRQINKILNALVADGHLVAEGKNKGRIYKLPQ